MTVKESTFFEQEAIRLKRNERVLQQFKAYLEKRRYPKQKLIAEDAGILPVSLNRFVNQRSTLSNENLDKLEEFMKYN